MTDRAWRSLFVAAALANLGVGGAFALAPAATISLLGLTPVADPLFPRLSGVLIASFGVAYAIVARDLERREIAALGAAGKLAAVVSFTAAWLAGGVPGLTFAFFCGDLVFAAAFLAFLRLRAPRR